MFDGWMLKQRVRTALMFPVDKKKVFLFHHNELTNKEYTRTQKIM